MTQRSSYKRLKMNPSEVYNEYMKKYLEDLKVSNFQLINKINHLENDAARKSALIEELLHEKDCLKNEIDKINQVQDDKVIHKMFSSNLKFIF